MNEKQVLLNLLFYLKQNVRNFKGSQSHFKKDSSTHKWYGEFVHDYQRAYEIVQDYMYQHQDFLNTYTSTEVQHAD